VPQNLELSSSKLILIGEDDIDDQEFLKEIFSSLDDSFIIVFTTNGMGILNYLDTCNDGDMPCLILLDYNMPGLTGLEILKELKSRKRFHKIPKIIWSTSRSANYRDICLEMGANEYLVKPSNVNDLMQTCRQILDTCFPKKEA
jgi:CheY-like chemotaxis protein